MKIFNAAKRIIILSYSVIMALIMVILLFFSKQSYYQIKDYNNMLLLPAGLLILFILLGISKGLSSLISRHSLSGCAYGWTGRLIIILVGILICFLQYRIISSYYFYTGWDVQTIVTTASSMAEGYTVDGFGYYSLFPNNRMVTYCYYLAGWYCNFFLDDPGLIYMSFIALNCVICMAAGWLLYSTAGLLCKDITYQIFAYLVYIIIVVFSPWISIPYTDAAALFLPILTVRIYLIKDGTIKRLFKPAAIGFLSVLALALKPQAFIVTIAIILIEAIRFIQRIIDKTDLSQMLRSIVVFLIFAVFCIAGSKACDDAMDSMPVVNIQEGMCVEWPHYLMMGMNTEYMGGYSGEDVEFAKSFLDDQEGRNEAELDEAIRRIREMGPAGLVKQMVKKTLTNYNDGTFSWGGEGQFYKEIPDHGTGKAAAFFRDLYYNNSEFEGRYYKAWSNTEHAVWLAVLFSSLFAGILNIKAVQRVFSRQKDELSIKNREKKHEDYNEDNETGIAVIMLAVLGLTLFELLFEARARYLFIYVPLYILICTVSLRRITDMRKRSVSE